MWNSCSLFFHLLQQILRNQSILSGDKCQGRETTYTSNPFSFSQPCREHHNIKADVCKQTQMIKPQLLSISFSATHPHPHPHDEYAQLQCGKLCFSESMANNGLLVHSVFTLFPFDSQFPPVDPPTCQPLPRPPAASQCAGLKFQSQTETVSFWATRSVLFFFFNHLLPLVLFALQ